MIQFHATSTHQSRVLGCRREFPRQLLHRIMTLAVTACTTLFAQTFSTPPLKAESIDRPNIVLILADDLGWSDTTLFQTTKFYRTPNIERLASRGMTFTHAYSASPLCSPTRASILTGLSPARIGITAPTCHLPEVILEALPVATSAPNQKSTTPVSATRLSTEYFTLSEMLKDNGYATGHFGKWHLGPEPYSPLQHGFDVDIPHWPGPGPAGSYVAPWKYHDFDPQTPTEHIEDRMAEEAAAFMEKHRSEPFFLNYWMFSVHAPFDAKQTLIDKYKKSVDPNDPQRSPTYAAMVESMDEAVGTLLDTLDRLKIADNTIIIFASDNGGNMYNAVDGTSATSNSPLRGGKATMFEGGVRGPAIIAYPGFIASASLSNEVIQSSDFYPTLLDLLSIAPQPNQSFDGVSIVPALKGASLKRNAIFTFFPHAPGVPDWLPPSVSIHQSDWKLIRIFHGGENGTHRYKLFNLNEDLGETRDLSEKHPERVKALDALIDRFLIDTKAVVPLPNPNFKPSQYDLDKEGKAELKGEHVVKPVKNKPPGKPVAGWEPHGNAQLTKKGNSLVINSDGQDPYLVYPLPKTFSSKSMTLVFAMSSNSSGEGQLFWKEQSVSPPYLDERSVKFPVNHEGASREYSIKFTPNNPIDGIRLDPSRGKGKISLENVMLLDGEGNLLHNFSSTDSRRSHALSPM